MVGAWERRVRRWARHFKPPEFFCMLVCPLRCASQDFAKGGQMWAPRLVLAFHGRGRPCGAIWRLRRPWRSDIGECGSGLEATGATDGRREGRIEVSNLLFSFFIVVSRISSAANLICYRYARSLATRRLLCAVLCAGPEIMREAFRWLDGWMRWAAPEA